MTYIGWCDDIVAKVATQALGLFFERTCAMSHDEITVEAEGSVDNHLVIACCQQCR